MALVPLADGATRAVLIVTLTGAFSAVSVIAWRRMLVRARFEAVTSLLAALAVIASVAIVLAGSVIYHRFAVAWAPPVAGAAAVIVYLSGFLGARAAFARRAVRYED